MEYWIWLRRLKGIGPIIEKRLLEYFGSPKKIYEACEEELLAITGIGTKLAKNIIINKSLEESFKELEKIHKYKIKLLTYNNPLYPKMAKENPESPTLLYYKGNIKENSIGVAIVGSRRCTRYGKEITMKAADYLAKNNIPVISGMAKGIDGYAHIACLKAGGYTIAFIGNGLDICYPKEHTELMKSIIENGAVVSEYPPNTKARPEHFPRRNFLISSWSKKILVAEAAEKSGALITADIAKKQGKEVLVPPHEIYSSTGKGSNKLIAQGAKIYLHPSQLLLNSEYTKDIKTKINIKHKNQSHSDNPKSNNNKTFTSDEKQILSCLTDSIKTIEEISKYTEIDQVLLIEYLTVLELEGVIESLSGGRFRRRE